jgi:hypothetical protein
LAHIGWNLIYVFFECRGLQDMEDALLTTQAVMPNLAGDADEGANSSMTTLMSKRLYSKLMNLTNLLMNIKLQPPYSVPDSGYLQNFRTTTYPPRSLIILDSRTLEEKPHRVSKLSGTRQTLSRLARGHARRVRRGATGGVDL